MTNVPDDFEFFNSLLPTNAERQWKEIPGYEGIYAVSSDGYVGSLRRLNSMGRRVRPRVLKMHNSVSPVGQITGVGVSLHDGKSQKTFNVGRAALMAFSGDCKDKDATYVDGNPLNNHLSNMEWKSRSEIRKAISTRKQEGKK